MIVSSVSTDPAREVDAISSAASLCCPRWLEGSLRNIGCTPSHPAQWRFLCPSFCCQFLSFRRFLFCAERLCHHTRLRRQIDQATPVCRLRHLPVWPVMAVACCGFGGFCGHRDRQAPVSSVSWLAQQCAAFFRPVPTQRNLNQPAARTIARLSSVSGVEQSELEHQHRILHLLDICRSRRRRVVSNKKRNRPKHSDHKIRRNRSRSLQCVSPDCDIRQRDRRLQYLQMHLRFLRRSFGLPHLAGPGHI